ncbi:hypothetical protein [Clostridium sp. JN-9]|uniref:hypothetical protein n=1 Tax=Clostridium sp. JN-9 TaxID=2507159 RepID=UPI000FFE1A7F|nr:hypothetical protein [Clostridium sp. JN-9]QAT39097.1 hypothetical protein EQM05_01820 [Clostridium sp. JN-9]
MINHFNIKKGIKLMAMTLAFLVMALTTTPAIAAESSPNNNKSALITTLNQALNDAKKNGVRIEKNATIKSVESCTTDEIKNAIFELKAATEWQKEFNNYKSKLKDPKTANIEIQNTQNVVQPNSIGTLYVVRQDGAIYEGTQTVSVNGETRKVSYSVNVYSNYCHTEYADQYGDPAYAFYKLFYCWSSQGNGGDPSIKSYTQNACSLESHTSSSYVISGAGTIHIDLFGIYKLFYDVPFRHTFYVPNGTFQQEYTYPPA